MPKFKTGAPQVTFRKRNGKTFTKTYHTRSASAKSIKAWRRSGGRVVKTGTFNRFNSNLYSSKSGLTQRSGKATRNSRNRW